MADDGLILDRYKGRSKDLAEVKANQKAWEGLQAVSEPAPLASTGGHELRTSVVPPNSSGGAGRYRAFCRCHWVGDPTDDEDKMREAYDQHVREEADDVAGRQDG